MSDQPGLRATQEFLERLDRAALAVPTGPLDLRASLDLRVALVRSDRRAIPDRPAPLVPPVRKVP